ncbi:MAG: hypothetical protein IJK04_10405, partial [Kiritimatiellae bacterium]|nr:hypothetical protein [Kiritimatiellia bacterium]
MMARVIQRFRPGRFTCGNETIRPVQPIDKASWIGAGGASRRRFLRFRRRFTGRAKPLLIDVSADARFALLLDGHEIAR